MMRLASKIGLVTGAGSGIGRAISLRYASEGASLVISDLLEAGLQETAAMIAEAGRQSVTVPGDVTERADAERMVQAAVERWGRLDVLVNNAGITGSRQATLAHLTPDEEWDRVLAVNVSGMFRVASAAIRQMLTQGGGAIVNVASVAGFVPFPERAAYNTSKGAVISFTRALAFDYAPNHIRANAI
jgi:NAD(P)-dependent dehydrogenase (short-subunit alcohol dehydrogenase family)